MTTAAENFSPFQGSADQIQDFYERYPYPRPLDNLDNYRQRWRNPQHRKADFHLFWPRRAYLEKLSILVAGCGTSQAAKHAIRWPQAEVIGIDFSATSISCTEKLKQKYKLKNLTLYQLPIERVGELDQQFDQIVSTGVLHHLPDPDLGLAALQQVLKPDGAMHLMVYAPYGRTGIYMLQEFCRRLGIEATDAGIRETIAALKVLPPGHPLGTLLREAPDFRHEAALADALLNPQDRAYSVPDFIAFLQRAGLSLGRWLKQAPYSALCGDLAGIPQAKRLAQLPLAEQSAAAELFRGTMVRHSAVVYRSDRSGENYTPDFAGSAWLDYVPVRMADTICVEERLPPGAAGVLINRSHSYRDIYLPISASEKAIYLALDGDKSIAEIVQGRGIGEGLRKFFECLWWHDQVVFDWSRSPL